jgi:hypothetical protein
MKKFIIAIVLCLFATLASASEPVRIKYNGSRGWDVSSPLYRSTTNQTRSKVRYYENLPKKQVREAFRDFDRNVNRSLKKFFR